MCGGIDWFVFYHRARREVAQAVPVSPIPRRPDGTGCKATATMRAYVAQHVFHTGRAKRAFETTDARLGRIWRQPLVAVFTGWPQRQCFDDFLIFFGDSILSADVFFGSRHECGARSCSESGNAPAPHDLCPERSGRTLRSSVDSASERTPAAAKPDRPIHGVIISAQKNQPPLCAFFTGLSWVCDTSARLSSRIQEALA